MDPGIEWRALEHHHQPKGIAWYWITIVVALLLVAVAVWQQNIIFAFLIIIGEVLIVIWGNREPETVSFRLDHTGLTIAGKEHLAYGVLHSYSVFAGGPHLWPELVFHTTHHIRHTLRIFVPPERLHEIDVYLNAILPKIAYEESLTETLARVFGF
ncbi:MAG: hypothetical protein HY978_03140 [Candidatus Liptonbacteria bacterium]|nr:hypothetical protein [Candidatus Liptonbacteria bacterium]